VTQSQSRSPRPPAKAKRAGRPKLTRDSTLTRRQELFVKELVSKDGQITKREAAENAGYPKSSAHTRSYEMTNPAICPHVVAKIQSYRTELDEKYGINFQRHIRDLQIIRDLALNDKNYSAAVMAEKSRGAAEGSIYVTKSEVRHGSIDSMSREDVLKALREIRGSYSDAETAIIDVTPEGAGASDESEEAGERLLESVEDRPETEPEEDNRDTP
jgi:phage terminase small subunit